MKEPFDKTYKNYSALKINVEIAKYFDNFLFSHFQSIHIQCFFFVLLGVLVRYFLLGKIHVVFFFVRLVQETNAVIQKQLLLYVNLLQLFVIIIEFKIPFYFGKIFLHYVPIVGLFTVIKNAIYEAH